MTEKILIDRELLERCKLLADDPMGLDFEEHAAIYNELNAALRAALAAPQQEPVGEEVRVVATVSVSFDEGDEGSAIELVELHTLLDEGDTELMTVTQHQRILEEALQGQRVLAMEVEVLRADNDIYKSCNDELKAEVERLRAGAKDLQQMYAAARYEVARLKSGMKGDYDLDAWLEWTKEKERLQATCDGLDRQNDGLYLELEQAVAENAKLREEVSAARITGLRMALDIWDQGIPGAYYAKALEEAIEGVKAE
jgi:hypothetical protein